jgi:choline dehydrogenase-like flavoprotein
VVGPARPTALGRRELTEAGFKVAVLEAGRKLDPSVDYHEHKFPYEMLLRGRREAPRAIEAEQPVQTLCYQCDEYASHLFVKDTENPYTTPRDRPFAWIRGRHVGGKSIMWARQSYRLSDYDLKAAGRDGFGTDWPLDSAELAPYYERVERFIGISGEALGMPQLPDSVFLPPMPLNCGEMMARRTLKEKFDRTLTIGRVAVLTAPLNGRPPCHYCGPCGRGCTTGSYYSSPASSLPAAEATGRLTLIPNAVVSHVELDDTGRCRSVAYIDRVTRAPREVFGKTVVLCASTLESTRIMLNSRSDRHPNGLSNGSGTLGRYLMDHIMGGGAHGRLPVPKKYVDERARRPNGIYVPRFRNIQDKHPDFLLGYGFQGGASLEKWGHAFAMPGFGATFKKRVREEQPWMMRFSGFGECLARHENFCELDKERVDSWGIPVLHISMDHSDNEKKMIQDMKETAQEMLHVMGAEEIEGDADLAMPGLAIHEVGTARMGNDPKSSVLNRWQQAHEVKNLFVMDGAVFPSSACQNPTLTMMALASRACAHLVDEYKHGNL